MRAWLQIITTVVLLVIIAILTRSVVRRLEFIDQLWVRMWKQAQSPASTSIITRCQERFERIVYQVMPRVNKGKYDPQLWYERYWGLQIDQYQYWKQNIIDDDIYSYWMFLRHLEWDRNDFVGNISYQEGWQHAVQKFGWKGTELEKFMSSVFAGRHGLIMAYKPPNTC